MAKRGSKLQEFVAHASNVNCLSIGKKSSRLLATGGEDQRVNLWAIGKPTSLLSLSGHTSPVESVTFDTAEVLILSGASFGVIKLWDLEEAKILRTLTGHRSSCNALQFHPFGEFFASGSSDASLKIWDVRKKGCIHTYKGHTRGVSTIKFSPDGRWVVSGGADNVVKIWDLTAGKLLHEFKYHEGQIQCIDFHPLEFLLATGSADRTVKFWDLETFEMIGSAGPEATGVRSMVFHPDGKTLFCGLEDSLKVFSWEPIVCHDSVDMGWSTLGDLNINEGKLLGCSYYHNCVGVWAADISLVGPYVSGTLPTRSAGHMQQKVDIKESHGQHNSGTLVTPPDIESLEIRNIYEDTSGSNKITPDRMRPFEFSKDVPLDSSKTSSPFSKDSSKTSSPTLRRTNPEPEVHVKNSSQVNNRQLATPLIVPRNNMYTENVVTSRREVMTTENDTSVMALKAAHAKITDSKFDIEKIPVTNDRRNNPSPENIVRFRSEATTTENNLPVVKPTEMRRSSSRSSPENIVRFRSEATTTENNLPVIKPTELRRSSSRSSPENNVRFRSEATTTENNLPVVKPTEMRRSSSSRKYETKKLSAQFDTEKSPATNESRSNPSAENIIHSRREATATENNLFVVKETDMRRSSSRKYETEKLLPINESGRFSRKQGDPYVAPSSDSSSRIPPKVEPTETVGDSPKNIRSVAEKFERILSPETPLRSSRDSAQPQSCSREISSSKKSSKDQLGRTRSLVERWERRETCSSDEEVANTRLTSRVREAPAIASTNIIQESHESSQMSKEPPQTSGRDSASMNEEIVLEDLKSLPSSNLRYKKEPPQTPGRDSTSMNEENVLEDRKSLSSSNLRYKKEPPQTSGRDSAYMNEENVLEDIKSLSSSNPRYKKEPPQTSGRNSASMNEENVLEDRKSLSSPNPRYKKEPPQASGRNSAPVNEENVLEDRKSLSSSNLRHKKEPPQTSGRDSTSMNEENVLEDLMRDHEMFTSSFHSRLSKLQVVRYFWQRTDVKGGLNAVGKLPDHSVQADVITVLKEKMDIVSLELFSCLLPILLGLLHSQIDRHTQVSLEMLLKLVAIFGPVIRSTMSASPSIGVDLQAERRRDRCTECFIQLQKIKQMIPSLTRRGGQLGKYALELNLLLQD